MEIRDSRIDAGKAFDWGRVSQEYAKYRDIYPAKFYDKIVSRGVGASLNAQELADWELEHTELLKNIAPEQFEVLHYAALAELRVKK